MITQKYICQTVWLPRNKTIFRNEMLSPRKFSMQYKERQNSIGSGGEKFVKICYTKGRGKAQNSNWNTKETESTTIKDDK